MLRLPEVPTTSRSAVIRRPNSAISSRSLASSMQHPPSNLERRSLRPHNPVMTPRERTFPDGFVWGTATAAHQVEGGNWNNDWWAWEHTPGVGVRRAERGRLRPLAPLARRSQLAGRAGVRELPVLARVEPDRARGGRALPGRPGPLPGHVRRLPGAGAGAGGHLPPLHHPPLGGRGRGLGRTGDRRAVRPL